MATGMAAAAGADRRSGSGFGPPSAEASHLGGAVERRPHPCRGHDSPAPRDGIPDKSGSGGQQKWRRWERQQTTGAAGACKGRLILQATGAVGAKEGRWSRKGTGAAGSKQRQWSAKVTGFGSADALKIGRWP